MYTTSGGGELRMGCVEWGVWSGVYRVGCIEWGV